MSKTCLITGDHLDSSTREEHTILRSLGGRICSRTVSSNAFNNACSRSVDGHLRNLYFPLMVFLDPMLARAHKPGMSETYGLDGTRYLTQDGVTRLAKEKILSRDSDGSPSEVLVSLKSLKDRDKVFGKTITEATFVPPPDDNGNFQVELFSSEADVAALKCVLLSFDHLCDQNGLIRFTRSPSIAALRDYIRDVVMNGNKLDYHMQFRHVMGLQLERDQPLTELAAKLRDGLPPHQLQEFEHVMIASGNALTGRLEVAWHILGVEWQGYRLTNCWEGPDFTCMFVNQVLKGGKALGPLWIKSPNDLCKLSRVRAVRQGGTSDAEVDWTMKLVSEIRQQAWRRAIYLTEMESDAESFATGLLSECIWDKANENSLAAGCVRHMQRRYPPAFQKRPNFEAALKRLSEAISSCGDCHLSSEDDIRLVNWREVLAEWRNHVAAFKDEFGYPGHFFCHESVAEKNRNGEISKVIVAKPGAIQKL